MIYDVVHLTRYRYGAPVSVNACVLRLSPRDEPGQKVDYSRIEFSPRPALTDERLDIFGNHTVRIRIEGPHHELSIKARSRVEVARAAPPIAALTPAWETIVTLAAETDAFETQSPVFAIYPSRRVRLFDAVTTYARKSFPPGRPIYEAAFDLTKRIRADFAYDAKATEVTTAPEVAFAARRGVCQDFAQVMIAGLRGLGLPAQYVSGYIRTIPPPGKARLQGADASHAWVSVWCGPPFGWLGLDPTNAIAESDDHVVTARGRDYADVPPVEGVIISSGEQRLHVEVDVLPIEGAKHVA